MRIRYWARINAALMLCLGSFGCHRDPLDAKVPISLSLSSSAFKQGEPIPKQFTCDGTGVSPNLSWGSLPPSTRSLALIAVDKDALFGSFTHWIVYDIPANVMGLSAGMAANPQLPDGSRQGLNGKDATGYTGPCPPGKSTHHYVFTLYALDTQLTIPGGGDKKLITQAMQGHVLAAGRLLGTYQH